MGKSLNAKVECDIPCLSCPYTSDHIYHTVFFFVKRSLRKRRLLEKLRLLEATGGLVEMANGEKVSAAATVEIFWLEFMKGLEKESVLVVNKVEDKFEETVLAEAVPTLASSRF